MRKKSHISLARYMVDTLNDENLKKYKLSFYLGSILPDIKPSFVYKRHEITETFSAVQRHIKRLSEGKKFIEKKKNRRYYRDLGQISHYLADYFTFPHNKIYPGSLKDHCSYEEQLKRDLRSYLKSDEAAHRLWMETAEPAKWAKEQKFENAEAICGFIRKCHEEYVERTHGVDNDILHIVSVNHRALEAMMRLMAEQREDYRLQYA
ncbi:MAG: zinc dependent phospholipase C family protein [Roseburia sp.]